MLEGLDADDGYIMVEDEFYATAKTFTQHLHHAEYQRLKNSAKMKSASAMSNIMRATDSITAMREETKKKKEAELKAMKHKAALEKIKALGGSKRLRTGDSDSNSESDLETTKNDDPWVGTNLQSLMVNPSKNGTSLTGLDRIKSSTRAAAGYSKPDHQPNRTSKPLGLAAPRAIPSKRAAPEQSEQEDDDEATASEDDDDLDAPVLYRKAQTTVQSKLPASHPQREPTPHTSAKQVNFKSRKPQPPEPTLPPLLTSKPKRNDQPQSMSKPNPRSSSSTTTSTSTKSILKPAKALPDFDVYDDLPLQPVVQSEASKRRLKRMAELKAGVKNEGSNPTGTGNINEIPIFLV